MDRTSLKDRRTTGRYPLRLPVEIDPEGDEFEALQFESSNISVGGVFIETATPLPGGTEVSVRFYLEPLDMNIRARGWVVRSQPERCGGAPPGMAIRFTEKGKIGSRLLKGLLDAQVTD